ncbi:hypothetical protein PCASD_12101 [Puccinia coronata f. sp. avenae]|uniref:Uncharacterized protein n=1 Tax=Puccinia coronata f. sp. avenae TaxID=200324 RepID=A0A2N5UDT0_9BASI|nr:hypothetical protein PCASD_23834 [Puccinia coronata f. sp. avenae]PLW35902.1 hypothetical protein PCASD_12101 [Puccinia coronata f. sp. avenae]
MAYTKYNGGVPGHTPERGEPLGTPGITEVSTPHTHNSCKRKISKSNLPSTYTNNQKTTLTPTTNKPPFQPTQNYQILAPAPHQLPVSRFLQRYGHRCNSYLPRLVLQLQSYHHHLQSLLHQFQSTLHWLQS